MLDWERSRVTIISSSDGSEGSRPPVRSPDAVKASERVVAPEAAVEDQVGEPGLRPRRLADYMGQTALKTVMQVAIDAALQRNEALDHVLLYGPPGLGKTTMAQVIGAELGVTVRITSAPALERPRDIAGLLASLAPSEVLFIDEIHRLNRLAEEILYPAMEDFSLDITIGKGTTARVRRVPLPRFTLIGATTRAGALSSPLRDRFGLIQRLNYYEPEVLQAIVLRSAELMGIVVETEGAAVIARRARGTPRIANRLLRRVRDWAQLHYAGRVSAEAANEALDGLGVDPLGLDAIDRELLRVMITQYHGGPVGIETLAAAISEDVTTIEDLYEPYLLQSGLLARTPRGRVATPRAGVHLGLTLDSGPGAHQLSLPGQFGNPPT